MGSTPQHPGYEEMSDTPWITQGREIADVGGKGVLENYNKVNVFDEGTRDSLEARNNAIYNRAFGDASDQYMKTMNKYAGTNYNRFGTLNATAPSYMTDQYRKDYQRQMDNLAYNKAINYETLINNELQRRYNTLNMYGDLYGYGSVPYQQDVANWKIRNANRDIQYKNAKEKHQGLGSLLGAGAGGVETLASYMPTFSNLFNSTAGDTAGSWFGSPDTFVSLGEGNSPMSMSEYLTGFDSAGNDAWGGNI